MLIVNPSTLARQMSQREKNMVVIGAGQINNTINENANMPGIGKELLEELSEKITIINQSWISYFS